MPLGVNVLGDRGERTVRGLGGHIARQATNGASWPPKAATKSANVMPKSAPDQLGGTTSLGFVALSYAAGLDRVGGVWVRV